ncbi:MAG: protein kinase [Planctomycetota bacterium]
MAFEWTAGSDDGLYRPAAGPLERFGVQRVDRYELVGRVGEGGMGVVYQARDPHLNRLVAVKLLLSGRSASVAQLKRFGREVDALSRLRHPNLLQVHAIGELQGCPYVVTEWLEGEDLADKLKREGALEPAAAAEIVAALARAVAHAHAQGVLHRDIKPTNVVFVPGRGPVLIDFGLAKETDPGASRLTRTGAFAGTAGYAAPEQLLDAKSVDQRADVYALGATLYTLLTGEPPLGQAASFQELVALVSAGKIPPPSERRPGVPGRLDDIVQRAMAPLPVDRIASAEALAEELETWDAPAPASPARGALRLAVALLAALGLGALAARAWPRGEASQVASSAASPGESASSPVASPGASPAPDATATASTSQGDGAPPASSRGQDARALTEAREGVGAARQELRRLTDQARIDRFLGPGDVRRRVGELEAAFRRGLAGLERLEEAATTNAERAARAYDRGAWLADAGRWDQALAALALARAERAAAPRAWLTTATTLMARPDAEGMDEQQLANEVREALQAARRSEEPAARDLGALWLEMLSAKRPGTKKLLGWVQRAGDLCAPGGAEWIGREAWIFLARTFAEARGEQARQGVAQALSLLEPRVTIPYWSHAFGEAWIPSWKGNAVSPPQLRRMELLYAHSPTLPSGTELFDLATRIGYLDTLERLLAVPLPAEQDATIWRKQAIEVAERTAQSKLAGRIDQPGYMTIVLVPDEPAALALVRVPEDAGGWELRLSGAEQDLDLLVHHDAPVVRDDHETLRGESMARDETLRSGAAQDGHRHPPTTGVHQAKVYLGTLWTEPVRATLELRVNGKNEGPPPRWLPAWEVTPLQPPESARAMLAKVRQESLAGRVKEALTLLDPWRERYPELVLVHASVLQQAGDWEGLRALSPQGPRPEVTRVVAFARALAAAALGDLSTAEAELARLVQEWPRVLAAHEQLALMRIGLGQLAAARAGLERVAAEDRALVGVRALLDLVATLEGQGSLEDLLARVGRHVGHTRVDRLLLTGALRAGKAEWVPELYERIRAHFEQELQGEPESTRAAGPAALFPERLLWLEALVTLGRKPEAEAAAAAILSECKAPGTRHAVDRLRARLR